MRKRLLLFLVLLILSSLLFAKSIRSDAPDWLQPWYRGYSVKYFNESLPPVVSIDHDLHADQFMALTDYDNGGYQIHFNPKYEPSPKQSRMTLLHEMCHIYLESNGEEEIDQHGIKWETCMRDLARKGAFDDIW